ncbi:MAG: hypothetical protein JNK87_28455 [Bryobacterales bacterium]|nr:hypothetical protein [Bryobacterales bacterium]
MYETYRDKAEFFVIYIEEAHPSDLWQLPSNVKDDVIFARPKSEAERFGVAESCVRKLGIKIPALIDGLDNPVERAYTGWPDRLYLVDKDGRIQFKSAPGPFGFRPKALDAAIRDL